jgi:hypothetical protein
MSKTEARKIRKFLFIMQAGGLVTAAVFLLVILLGASLLFDGEVGEVLRMLGLVGSGALFLAGIGNGLVTLWKIRNTD